MLRPLFLLFAILFAGNLSAQVNDTLIPFREDTAWGYRNSAGEVVIPLQFTSAGKFTSGYAAVSKGLSTRNKQSWVIDRTGKAITPPVWGTYTILPGSPVAFVSYSYGTMGQAIYDSTGREIRSCAQCAFNRLGHTKYFTSSKGSMGSMDTIVHVFDIQGKEIYSHVGDHLDNVTHYSRHNKPGSAHGSLEGYYFLTIRDRTPMGAAGNKGLILDKNFRPVFDSIGFRPMFTDGKGVVCSGARCAFMDTAMNPIVPFSAGYSSMTYHPSDGCLTVKRDSLFGVIDTLGNVILPCIYPGFIHAEDSGFVFRVVCDNCGPKKRHMDFYVLRNGDTLISNDYYLQSGNVSTTDFHGPLTVKSKKNDKYGIVTHDRSVMIPCKYDALGQLKENRAVFFRGDTAGYIDAKGNEVMELWFPCYGLSDFENGRALASVLLPGGRDQYPTAQIISDGQKIMARRFVWIDSTGQIMNKQSFDWVTAFRDGYSLVINNGEQYLVDTSLKKMMLEDYWYTTYFLQGYAVITDGKKMGLADSTGKIVIPVEYDELAVRADGPGGVRFIGKNGHGDNTYSQFVVPDIVDGKITGRKGRKEEVLTVPGAK